MSTVRDEHHDFLLGTPARKSPHSLTPCASQTHAQKKIHENEAALPPARELLLARVLYAYEPRYRGREGVASTSAVACVPSRRPRLVKFNWHHFRILGVAFKLNFNFDNTAAAAASGE